MNNLIEKLNNKMLTENEVYTLGQMLREKKQEIEETEKNLNEYFNDIFNWYKVEITYNDGEVVTYKHKEYKGFDENDCIRRIHLSDSEAVSVKVIGVLEYAKIIKL